MATQAVLNKDGVAGFLFSNASEYNGTDLGDLENVDTTPTAVQLDLGDSVTTGVARQSTKCDLGGGTAFYPMSFAVTASIEFATAPTTGETVDFYWAPSHSGTAGKGNMGQVSGTDGAYSAGAAETAEGLKQLMFIGSLVASADATTFVQTAFIGVLSPPDRYGSLVVHNNTSVSFFTTDAIEMAVAFEPIVPDVQAAV
jgi:hypothetical protein